MRGETVESYPVDGTARLFRSLDGVRRRRVRADAPGGGQGELRPRERRRVLPGGGAEPHGRLRGPQLALLPLGGAPDARRRWRRRSRATAAWARSRTSCPVASASPGAWSSSPCSAATGELVLKGLRVRWGLGLRENLFVVDRELDRPGSGGALRLHGQGLGTRRRALPGGRVRDGARGLDASRRSCSTTTRGVALQTGVRLTTASRVCPVHVSPVEFPDLAMRVT